MHWWLLRHGDATNIGRTWAMRVRTVLWSKLWVQSSDGRSRTFPHCVPSECDMGCMDCVFTKSDDRSSVRTHSRRRWRRHHKIYDLFCCSLLVAHHAKSVVCVSACKNATASCYRHRRYLWTYVWTGSHVVTAQVSTIIVWAFRCRNQMARMRWDNNFLVSFDGSVSMRAAHCERVGSRIQSGLCIRISSFHAGENHGQACVCVCVFAHANHCAEWPIAIRWRPDNGKRHTLDISPAGIARSCTLFECTTAASTQYSIPGTIYRAIRDIEHSTHTHTNTNRY